MQTSIAAATAAIPSRRRAATFVSLRPRRMSCEAAPITLHCDVSYEEKEARALGKVGARVRVGAPLRVYHVPRVPEVEMEGREGVVKQYVVVWKGKRISSNLPFKVEFVVEGGVRERPETFKFFAHLSEDELEWIE